MLTLFVLLFLCFPLLCSAKNMVGPGEVDEDLESETAEECTKYGPVVRCKIYEEKNPMVPSDKSVRIFVQFTTLDSALKGTPAGD